MSRILPSRPFSIYQRPAMYLPDHEPPFPEQYTPLSNEEQKGKLDLPQTFDSGIEMEDSYIGVQLGRGDHGLLAGYDTEDGAGMTGIATEVGRLLFGGYGQFDPFGAHREIGGGAKIAASGEMRGQDVGFEGELSGGASDDVKSQVLPSGRVRVTRSQTLHAGVGLGGSIEYLKVGGSGERSEGKERSAEVDGPAWLAAVARAGSPEAAARELIPHTQVDDGVRTLEDGQSLRQSTLLQSSGRIGVNVFFGVDATGSTGWRRELSASRQGDQVRLEVRIESTSGSELEGSAGFEILSTYSAAATGGESTQAQIGAITLDVNKDAALIATIEACSDPHVLQLLIEGAGGRMTSETTRATSQKRATGYAFAEYVGEADGSLTESDTDGRKTFTAAYDDQHRVDPLGLHLASDTDRARLQLREGDDGRFDLVVTESNTLCELGYDGLPELDLLGPIGTMADLLTKQKTVQKMGWSLDADQLDALIDKAGTDDWSNGGNSARGGPADAQWMLLGSQLHALEKLPEADRNVAQAELIARFAAQGGDVLAFDRILDEEAGSLADGSRMEWPETLFDGRARFEDLEQRLAQGGDSIALMADVDRFRAEVCANPGFTMPRAKSDLLERLNAIRSDANEHAMEQADATDVVDLSADQIHADLVTDLARLRDYAQHENAMYSRLDAHDRERAVTDLSNYYSEWREVVMRTRETYEAMGIAPESWQVSAPGLDRSVLEPTGDSIRKRWSAMRPKDDRGVRERILPRATY